MKYFVTGWCGIPGKYLNEESVLAAKECGLDVLWGGYGREKNIEALDLFSKCGVSMMLYDDRVGRCLGNPSLCDTLIPEIVADYGNHPALHSYYIVDEPGCAAFGAIAAVVRKFKECDKAHPAYVNLFPNYANEQQLGCPTYDEHIARFIAEVQPEIISYDHYHFLTENPVSEEVEIKDEREAGIYQAAQKRTARAGFFDNFEAVRRDSLKSGIPYMLIILLTEHGPYRYLTKAEIEWEVYMCFAYGVSAMSYFTYWTPDYDPLWHFRNGIITADGKKTPHYFNVKEINEETRLLGERIAGTKSVEVFHVGEEKENVKSFPCDGFGGIKAISGGRYAVGFYENGEFLIANKDFSDISEVTLDTDGKKIEKFDKQNGTWSPCANTVTLTAGCGELFRLAQ